MFVYNFALEYSDFYDTCTTLVFMCMHEVILSLEHDYFSKTTCSMLDNISKSNPEAKTRNRYNQNRNPILLSNQSAPVAPGDFKIKSQYRTAARQTSLQTKKKAVSYNSIYKNTYLDAEKSYCKVIRDLNRKVDKTSCQ